ncbi:MAG: hypothetical protein AB1453_02285 [Chloroflexota bacterium]|jgi:hypothetical protein
MKLNWRYLVGVGLIALGILALLDNVFSVNLGAYLWSVLFILAGGAFVAVLVNDRNQWWASFPGFTLLGIGALIGLSELIPGVAQVGGALVLGGIGMSFVVVYLLRREFWWALIPAGVMASLVVMILVEPLVSDSAAWLFLLGLGLTFGAVYLIPGPNGEKMEWAIWPAGAMIVLSLIVMVASVQWAGYLVPIIMILLGGALVLRALRRS